MNWNPFTGKKKIQWIFSLYFTIFQIFGNEIYLWWRLIEHLLDSSRASLFFSVIFIDLLKIKMGQNGIYSNFDNCNACSWHMLHSIYLLCKLNSIFERRKKIGNIERVRIIIIIFILVFVQIDATALKSWIGVECKN